MKNINNSWKAKYLTLIISQSFSSIGRSSIRFIIIWILASETKSPSIISLAGIFSYLPQILLSPIAGVYIDRLNRKKIIIATNLFVSFSTFFISLFFSLDYISVWSVYLLMSIFSLGNAFLNPALQSIIPMIVPKNHLVKANGLNYFSQSGANIIGPFVGAYLYTVLPIWFIFFINIFITIISSITMGMVKISPPIYKQTSYNFKYDMKMCFVSLKNNKTLLTLTLVTFFAIIFYAPLNNYFSLITITHFDKYVSNASIIESVYILGMLLTALTFSYLDIHINNIIIMHLGTIIIGLSTLFCGFLPSSDYGFFIFAAFCFFSGAGYNLFNIPFITYIQETISSEELGRIYSLVNSLSSLSLPLGYILAGFFSEIYGIELWFIIAGIAICLLSIISSLIIRSISSK